MLFFITQALKHVNSGKLQRNHPIAQIFDHFMTPGEVDVSQRTA
jgi:hypothetical protein